MPELPEVETVRNTLKTQILNKTVKNVKIFYEKMIESPVEEFKQLLIGETLKDIYRYGKYLFFIFEHVSVMSHLRMEGKFFLKTVNDPILKHEHVEIEFSDGTVLRYHDTRKFGIMRLLKMTNYEDFRSKVDDIKKLGKECWISDTSNKELIPTKEEVFNKLNKSSLPIKTLLLDQSILCGMGNIYVDEVLFLSKIHPMKKGCEITLDECDSIINNANVVLHQAVLCGGTTIRSYTSSLGVTGRFQINLKVHTKDGSKCVNNCGETILKMKVGGRGTYFCPTCQKYDHHIIGITGGIGTGKSIVSNYLLSKGFEVIDSDLIVHNLYKESSVKKQLVLFFGDSIIKNKQIDFDKLREIVFNNDFELQRLNNYVHPLVINEINYLIKCSGNKNIFVDIPLLFENHLESLCDEIWCVYASTNQQIERIMERNCCSKEDAVNRISKQLPLEDKIKRSNITIDNSQELCYTYKQLDEQIKRLTK